MTVVTGIALDKLIPVVFPITGMLRDRQFINYEMVFVVHCPPMISALSSLCEMTLAGTPPTMAKGGTCFVTTAPAAMMAPLPMRTPLRMVTLQPIQTSLSIETGAETR